MTKYFYKFGLLAFLILYISFVRNVYSQNPATDNAEILNFPNIIINEVSYKDSENDWIELLIVNDENNGNGNNIKGLKLRDDSVFFEIEEDFNVKTNDYLMIYFKSDIEKVEIDYVKKFFITKSGLTGTSEQVVVLNRDNEIIDAVCWTNGAPTTSEIDDFNELYSSNQWLVNNIQSCINSNDVLNGNSIARKNNIDTNSINDWEIFINPTPENENIEIVEINVVEVNEIEEEPIDESTEILNVINTEDNLQPTEVNDETIDECLSNIQINEILPNPTGKDTGNEWIELINNGEKDCNLEGLYIDDKDGGSKPFYIENKLLIANRFLLLPSWETKINLNNSEDEVRIYSKNDKMIDSVKYDKSFENKSYAKSEEDEFLWTKHITPLTNNIFEDIVEEDIENNETESTKKTSSKKKSDPKKNIQNGTLSEFIKFNEIFPNPKGQDKGSEWIEIINDSEDDILLGNWKITDDEEKKIYVFDNEPIEGNTTKVLSDQDLGFSLKNTDGIFKLIDFENNLIDRIDYEKAEENKSFARIAILENDEETNDWQWTEKISKDYPNPSLQNFSGLITNFDILENKLELQLDSNKENIVVSVIQSGDTLYETIFTEDTKIKITTSENEAGEKMLEAYEVLEQALPKEKTSDDNNLLYIVLSALGPCSYFGYKGIRKFGLIKII